MLAANWEVAMVDYLVEQKSVGKAVKSAAQVVAILGAESVC